ncbi:hypothetical protein Nmel_000387 [Mimus melanotis]
MERRDKLLPLRPAGTPGFHPYFTKKLVLKKTQQMCLFNKWTKYLLL